jgi:hypothetical protein
MNPIRPLKFLYVGVVIALMTALLGRATEVPSLVKAGAWVGAVLCTLLLAGIITAVVTGLVLNNRQKKAQQPPKPDADA